MISLNRTIDVQFEYDDLTTVSIDVQNGDTQDNTSADVSVENINIEIDAVSYDPTDYQTQVVLGNLLKGDKGDPGRTPERGEDYWTQNDIMTMENYIDNRIIQQELVWRQI